MYLDVTLYEHGFNIMSMVLIYDHGFHIWYADLILLTSI